ncbi:MAG: MFS transporter [Christensenellaceae bacterium]|nr:MFS transporter [Christensenellaceae bacterium]
MSKKSLFGLHVSYSAINGLYWILFVFVTNFAVMLLRERGIGEANVGFFLAAACVVVLLVQPLIASFADHHPERAVNRIMALVIILGVLGLVADMLLADHPILVVAIFIVSTGFIMSCQGMVAAISVRFIHRGIGLTFSVPRAIGSLSAAVGSLFLGNIADAFGIDTLFYLRIGIGVVLILLLLFFPNAKKYGTDPEPDKKLEGPIPTIGDILKRNKVLVFFLLGVAFMYSSLSCASTFFLPIINRVGGTNADFGFVSFLMSTLEVIPMFGYAFLQKRISMRTMINISALAVLARAVLLLFAGSVAAIALIIGVTMMLSTGLLNTTMVLFLDDQMTEHEKVRGQALGNMASFGAGWLIGNLAGSFSMSLLGLNGVIITSASIAALGVIMIFISTAMHKRKEAYKPRHAR